MLAFTFLWIVAVCDHDRRPIAHADDIDPKFYHLYRVIQPVNKPVIGIDFGTSFSRAAVFVDGKPEIVYGERGEWNHPSVVRFEEAGVSGSERILRVLSVKRLLCGDAQLSQGFPVGVSRANESEGESEVGKVESRNATTVDMISLIFERLKRLGEERIGERIENAVISVPSSFEEVERATIREAAGKAQLKVLHLLNEGTAAALWSFRRRDDDILSVVFHVGEGTFEISVIWLRETYYEVVGSDWKRGIGGISMDDRIVEHLLSVFKNRTGKDASVDFRAVERLRQASEAAKQALSEANETDIDLSDFFEGESLRERLTRSCFEDLISDLLTVMVDTTKRVLDGCLEFRGDPEHIVFSGGCTRIPKLQELICDLFDPALTPSFTVSEDGIALICAAEAASLMGDPSAPRFVHTSKHSLTLGVTDPSNPYRNTVDILNPGSSLPQSASMDFEWVNYYEENTQFGLYEGGCLWISKNRLVGRINFSGLVQDADGQTRMRMSVVLTENNHVNFTVEQRQTGRSEWGVFKVYSKWKHCEDERPLCGGSRSRTGWCEPIARRHLSKFAGPRIFNY